MDLQTSCCQPTTQSAPARVLCDASHDHENDRSSVGVVLKNHAGRTCDTCGDNLGYGYQTHEAEIEAITRALDALASDDVVQHVKVMSDAKGAVECVRGRDCIESGFEQVTFEWIPRDMNREAHLVAERCMAKDMQVFDRTVDCRYGLTD